MPQFAIRRVVLEYGALPIASWLSQIDSVSSLTYALVELREAAVADGNRCETLHFNPKLLIARMNADTPLVSTESLFLHSDLDTSSRLVSAGLVLLPIIERLVLSFRHFDAGLIDINKLAACLDVNEQHSKVSLYCFWRYRQRQLH